MSTQATDAPRGIGVYTDRVPPPTESLYLSVNAPWLAATTIPAEQSQVNPAAEVCDSVRTLVATLINGTDTSVPAQAPIRVLYDSFLDEAAIDELGMTALARLRPSRRPARICDCVELAPTGATGTETHASPSTSLGSTALDARCGARFTQPGPAPTTRS